MNSRVQPSGKTRSAASSTSRSGESKGHRNNDIVSDVRDTAKSAADTLKHQASDLGAEVGHELNKTASAQKERGAEALRSFAQAMNAAAQQLTGQSPAVANRVRETATKVEALSDSLAGKDVSDLLKSAANLAREQPAWFLGGAVAVGFGVTRFLMSKPPQTAVRAGRRQRSDVHGS
jgi:gas vesicle protein